MKVNLADVAYLRELAMAASFLIPFQTKKSSLSLYPNNHQTSSRELPVFPISVILEQKSDNKIF